MAVRKETWFLNQIVSISILLRGTLGFCYNLGRTKVLLEDLLGRGWMKQVVYLSIFLSYIYTKASFWTHLCAYLWYGTLVGTTYILIISVNTGLLSIHWIDVINVAEVLELETFTWIWGNLPKTQLRPTWYANGMKDYQIATITLYGEFKPRSLL